MAPKIASSASSAAQGSRLTRSGSKAGSSSKAGSLASDQRAASTSGVSKVAATASKRNSAASADSQRAAGGNVASAGSKAGKSSAKSQKSTAAASVLSPAPVANLRNQFNQASNEAAPPDDNPLEVSFLSLSDELLFNEISSNIARFDRFKVMLGFSPGILMPRRSLWLTIPLLS